MAWRRRCAGSRLVRSTALSIVVLATTVGTAAAASNPQRPARGEVKAHVPPSERFDVRLHDLTAVDRLYRAFARRHSAMSDGDRAGAWTDLAVLLEAVSGVAPAPSFSTTDLETRGAAGPLVQVSRGVDARDRAAYQMLAVGYSAREAADVVAGRITREALDMARRMIAAGQGRETAADFLDREYARHVRPVGVAVVEPPRGGAVPASPFDHLIAHYAALHRVDATLVRAIIAVESAFNPLALSHAGAIGLMQLMPMTARELGVNPHVPEQNIEGGVRYFSELLGKFGALELALVAYNAGPGFAQRYAQGRAALYGETREYVRRVLARLNGAR